MTSKVLVTGAGGFIGSHLTTDLVRQGHSVVALDLHLDRLSQLATGGSVNLWEGDVADPETQKRAVAGADTVFHLAAAHLGATVPEREFWRVNVDGVRTLVDAAREAGVRRFVHCSSVGVYGHVEHPPADEDSPCAPDLAYETTKLEGERIVLEAVRQHGFPAVVLRPVWVYGPGCPRTEKLFRAVKKGRFIVGGRGSGLRHCVYIKDMIRAFRLASESETAIGQVIIVGDAKAVTVRQLVDLIAELTDAKPPRSIPLPVLHAIGLLAELAYKPLGKEPPISRRTAKFFTANTSFSIARARKLLGYEPQYDLKTGLLETYERVSAEDVS